MPIDYKKYPANWKTEIRPSILERDMHRCKFCGIENYTIGYRGKDGTFYSVSTILKFLEDSGTDLFAEGEPLHCVADKKPIKIILTIAHLDHNIENNNFDNLAALCQKDHLDYDKSHHTKNSRETREKKKQLLKLF